MTEAEKVYQYFVIAVPENEEQAKAYFWARKALQHTITPPNEWVRVEERLPEQEGSYLVITESGAITTARFYIGTGFPDGYYRKAHWQRNRVVTHWMPFPAPPNRRLQEGEA